MRAFKSIVTMLIALLILDAVWIALFMQGLYQQEIPSMLKADPNLVAALIFYLAYPLGAYWLAVTPAVETQSARSVLWKGGLLGGTAYGTFAVTNLAVLENWSVTLTVVDVIWGTCVTATVSWLGYQVARR